MFHSQVKFSDNVPLQEMHGVVATSEEPQPRVISTFSQGSLESKLHRRRKILLFDVVFGALTFLWYSSGAKPSSWLTDVDASGDQILIRRIKNANDTLSDWLEEEASRVSGNSIAACVIDYYQSAFYISQAGIAIDSAVESCGESGPACSASVLLVIESFGWVASYISDAAALCAKHVNVKKADCAADVSTVTTCLTEFASDASGLGPTCGPGASRRLGPALSSIQTATVPQHAAANVSGRTLRNPASGNVRPGPHPTSGLRGSLSRKLQDAQGPLDVASCVTSLNMAGSYIARAGQQIDGAVCDNGKECAIDVENIVSSFAWVGSFLSLAVSSCDKLVSLPPVCAGTIIDLVATTASVVAGASSIPGDCSSPNELSTISKSQLQTN